MNKKIAVISVLVAVLIVSALAGTIVYYNGVVNQKDSQIANQNNEITNLTNQISNLTAEVTNLTSANLVTALDEIETLSSPSIGELIGIPYACFMINGSVTNTNQHTAFNAGLHIVAASSNGTLEINMTVPLANGGVVYGTDSAINTYILNHPSTSVGTFVGGIFGLVLNIGPLSNIGSLQLGSLNGGQTANVTLGIFHEGTVTNWTVTPVWTDVH